MSLPFAITPPICERNWGVLVAEASLRKYDSLGPDVDQSGRPRVFLQLSSARQFFLRLRVPERFLVLINQTWHSRGSFLTLGPEQTFSPPDFRLVLLNAMKSGHRRPSNPERTPTTSLRYFNRIQRSAQRTR